MTRTRGYWVLLIAPMLGCSGGDDDDGGGASSPAGQACYSLCDAQYKDCPDSVGTCRQLCDAVVPGLSADCQTKATAYYECGAGIEWTCQGLLANQQDPDQCKTELDQYVPCITQ